MPSNIALKFYLPKKIKDFSFEDNLVRISGTVLDKREDSLVLDDKTGIISVFLAEEDLDKIEKMDFVRIFGRLIPSADGKFEMLGDIVQKINIDLNLYNKIRDRWGVEI
jgi:hypothetical protein